jgi:hypothetical protein
MAIACISAAQVGVVTSATVRRLKETIALARLDVTHAGIGTEVRSASSTATRSVCLRARALPHYDPEDASACMVMTRFCSILPASSIRASNRCGRGDAVALLRQAGALALSHQHHSNTEAGAALASGRHGRWIADEELFTPAQAAAVSRGTSPHLFRPAPGIS